MALFRTVIFDCDSTLSAIEGIDELSAAHRSVVEALTEAAMRGEVPLEEVYGRRLAIVRPTRAAIEELGRMYVETLVPDAREVIAALRACGLDVRVVSGGLRPAVLAATRELGIPDGAVAAVDLKFDDAGRYAGYDEQSPLTRDGGKATAISQWRIPRPIMMVGDGATDLDTRPVVDAFVAYAGVAERDAVVAAADVVVRSPSLAPIFTLAVDRESSLDCGFHELHARGAALLPPDALRRAVP